MRPFAATAGSSAGVDLRAAHAASNYARQLGVRFHRRDLGWVATNGADPDDAALSDAYLEVEIAPDAPFDAIEKGAVGYRTAAVEIVHIQRGDAPPGTGHRLLTALLTHAQIIPTKVFGVIADATTQRIMSDESDGAFVARIADSPIVRMRTKALKAMALYPSKTVVEQVEHDGRSVEVLATYVDPISIRRRLAAGE